MYKTNKELATIFEEMANIYRFHGSRDRFRVRAYQNASRIINQLPEDIHDYMEDDKLEDIKGIGESIAEKIREYVKTGKVKKYEKLKKEVPHDFVELLDVKGIGPETLKTIREELDIKTKEDLVKALKSGKVEHLKGFGEKTVQNMLEGLEQKEKADERILLTDALEIVDLVTASLEKCKEIDKLEVAGSIRRRKETIGDVDLLATGNKKDWEKIMDFFTGMDDVRKIIAKGKTKSSIMLKDYNRQVDLRLIEPDQWGSALLYFTGSKEHNIHLRKIAIDQGYKINEYGLFTTGNGKRMAGDTEKGIYKKLDMQWIPPEMREDNGEIELAEKNKIPDLLTLDDVKGDFHVHSDWTDGTNSIRELGDFVNEELDYEYIVLTDHSKSARIAGGMDGDEFREQFAEIDEANDQIGRSVIKKGCEVDILPDGSLDLEDELLEEMEWVVASIHSRFNQDNTDRILKACEHRCVNAIGHPTGRLIGSRGEYPVNLEKVIKKAKETGTALEINAQPMRMDLNDHWTREAQQSGVTLVIGTDTHHTGSFTFMELGVAIARRGWSAKEHILNTGTWKKVEAFVKEKR